MIPNEAAPVCFWGKWGVGGENLCPFQFQKFFFIDDDIARGKTNSIRLDNDTLLDNNAVNHLRNFVLENKNEFSDDFALGLSNFGVRRFNWNPALYLEEVWGQIEQPEVFNKIFKTVKASVMLSEIDPEHFEKTKEFKLKIPNQDFDFRVNEILESRRTVNKSKAQNFHKLTVLNLLKMGGLKARYPSKEQAGKNITAYATWMQEQLGCWSPINLKIAWAYFNNDKSVEGFFKKVQKPYSELDKKIGNMAWDIAFLHRLHTRCGEIGRDNSYMLPGLLSYDKGLCEMFQFFIILGAIRHQDGGIEIIQVPNRNEEVYDILNVKLGFDPNSSNRLKQRERLRNTWLSNFETMKIELLNEFR